MSHIAPLSPGGEIDGYTKMLVNLAVVSICLFSIRIISAPMIFLPHVIMIILCVLLVWRDRTLTLDKTVALSFLIIAVQSFIGVLLQTTSLFLVIENLVKMLVYYLAFSSIIKSNPLTIRYIIFVYLKLCFYLAVIGIIGIASFVVDFKPGYDFSWFLNAWSHIAYGGHFGLPRSQSIFGEPSHAIYVMGPATFFAVDRIVGNNKSFLNIHAALTILVFLFLTNSTTLYLFLPVVGVFAARLTFKQTVLGIALVTAVWFGVQIDLSMTIDRLELLYQLAQDNGTTQGVSGSSYTAYVGYVFAAELVRETSGMGAGLGGFEYSFDRLFTGANFADGNMANTQTGGSLAARSVAEFGVFALLAWAIFGYTFIKGALRFKGPDKAIHIAFGLGVLPFIYRMGAYELFGLALFVLIYISNYKSLHENAQVPDASTLYKTRSLPQKGGSLP